MENQLTLWSREERSSWMDFRQARAYARSLNLASRKEWNALVRERGAELPGKIPLQPDEAYRHLGWKGWDDWLGVETEKEIDPEARPTITQSGPDLWEASPANPYLPFTEAREIARKYKFRYKEEWEAFLNGKFPGREPLPENVTKDPYHIYRYTGWKSWDDWLVDPSERKKFSDFHSAREFVRSLKIKNKQSWREYITGDEVLHTEYGLCLPEHPQLEYQGKGWVDWDDWLGTSIQYRSFKETRRFIHRLRLASRTEWELFCRGELKNKPRKSENVFSFPDLAYRDEGWQGWDHWLGAGAFKEESGEVPRADIPPGTVECWCKGQLMNCRNCGGKGYYYT